MTILHIDSSITGEASVSRKLTAAIVERLHAANPGATVVRRDLAAQPIEHLTFTAGDDGALNEFLAADTIVVGAPMYNFNISSQLKAWIDRILAAGKTFRYTAEGPEGLATGRRVIVAVSRGGLYEPGSDMEHVETYLRGVFRFIGIEAEFVHADGINLGEEARAAGIESGLQEAERLAA